MKAREDAAFRLDAQQLVRLFLLLFYLPDTHHIVHQLCLRNLVKIAIVQHDVENYMKLHRDVKDRISEHPTKFGFGEILVHVTQGKVFVAELASLTSKTRGAFRRSVSIFLYHFY
jgi:hypothetical protein